MGDLRRKLELERENSKQLSAVCEAKDGVIAAGEIQKGHLESLVAAYEHGALRAQEARDRRCDLNKSRADDS